jgi:hypothetical protein
MRNNQELSKESWVFIVFVLFFVSCAQRGLLPTSITSAATSSSSSSNSSSTSSDPSIVLEKPNGLFFISSFANYKNGNFVSEALYNFIDPTGRNFCYSAERFSSSSYVDAVPCLKPFEGFTGSEALPGEVSFNSKYKDLREAYAEYIRPRQRTGLIINGFQFAFNHYKASNSVTQVTFSSNDPDAAPVELKPSSEIFISSMYARTAPIKIDATGRLYWDKTQLTTDVYTGTVNDCDGDNGMFTTQIKIPQSLDNLSTELDERTHYFLSGLWMLERKEAPSFEKFPEGQKYCRTQGASEDLCGLFTGRTRIWSTYIKPTIVNNIPGFKFFPGLDGLRPLEPANNALSFESILGRYREFNSFVARVNAQGQKTIVDESLLNTNVSGAVSAGVLDVGGAAVTKKIGIQQQGPLGTNHNDWQNRALVEFCINGTRTDTNVVTSYGFELVTNVPIITKKLTKQEPVPLIKSIRAEFRTMKVR